jgi:ADP-heptose:LPS heptosyltransferase
MEISARYQLDRTIRTQVMRLMAWITSRSPEERVDLKGQKIKRILLVRGIFRMGDSILATPAVLLFYKSFPGAKIDFVGCGMSKALLEKLPIDRHYEIYRTFPKVCWSYVALLKQIRSVKYDLAVDVSGSSAALGSFIVGYSGARFRMGLKGRWDRWFNIRLTRPATPNKYENLPALFGSIGLGFDNCLPSLVLSPVEKEQATRRIETMAKRGRPVAGVFVGGRKSHGKRWPRQNFVELAGHLRRLGAQVIIFVGPEERELIEYFQQVLHERAPVVFEPDPRSFASLVAGCDLFVACDSGPMHLACALRVKTIAIFLKNNYKQWGPPARLARIVYRNRGVKVEDVVDACVVELSSSVIEGNIRKIVNE